ncbi:hypothetical protein YC2023_052137 [Brassica napus]
MGSKWIPTRDRVPPYGMSWQGPRTMIKISSSTPPSFLSSTFSDDTPVDTS